MNVGQGYFVLKRKMTSFKISVITAAEIGTFIHIIKTCYCTEPEM